MGMGNGWDNGHNGFDNGRLPIMDAGMPLGGGNGFDAGFDSGLGAIVDGGHGISKGAHKKGTQWSNKTNIFWPEKKYLHLILNSI